MYKPFHARFRHGLAVTMRGRVRKRQLHGMAWWYARKHGFSKEEWDAAIAPHREEYNRRVREDDRRWREEQGDK